MKRLLQLLFFICITHIPLSPTLYAVDPGIPANKDSAIQRLKNRIDLVRDKVATLKSDLSKSGSAKISPEEQLKRVNEIKAETDSIGEDTDRLGSSGLITSSYVHRFHSDVGAIHKDLSALTPKPAPSVSEPVASVPDPKTEKPSAHNKPQGKSAETLQEKIDTLKSKLTELKSPKNLPDGDQRMKIRQNFKSDIDTTQSDIVKGLSDGTIPSAHGQRLLSELTKINEEVSILMQPSTPPQQPLVREGKEVAEGSPKKASVFEELDRRAKAIQKKLTTLKAEKNKPIGEQRFGKQAIIRVSEEMQSEIESIRTDIHKRVSTGMLPTNAGHNLEVDLDMMSKELLALKPPAIKPADRP